MCFFRNLKMDILASNLNRQTCRVHAKIILLFPLSNLACFPMLSSKIFKIHGKTRGFDKKNIFFFNLSFLTQEKWKSAFFKIWVSAETRSLKTADHRMMKTTWCNSTNLGFFFRKSRSPRARAFILQKRKKRHFCVNFFFSAKNAYRAPFDRHSWLSPKA